MLKAVSYLVEPLLTQFFLLDAVCGDYIDENARREIFRKMTGVFCIDGVAETEVYFRTANEELYRSISDYPAYERLCRTLEFAQRTGQTVEMDAVDRVILARKREAMQIKSRLFEKGKNMTADLVADTLTTTAMNGNVDAMVLLAFMEYHGICVCQDRKNALKRLRLCAGWNHLFGNLMGIAYDRENADAYYSRLHTVLRSGDRREVFAYICKRKGVTAVPQKDSVASVLEKAFGMGIIKRDMYDRSFARVAFSRLISAEDKEKVLLNKKADAVAAFQDIPFDAVRGEAFAFDRESAKKIPLPRQEELNKLFCSIYPVTCNMPQNYRTLLVAGEDDYLSEMYAAALKAGFAGETAVLEVDAGTLSRADFLGGKEHFILRGLSETRQTRTVFLLKHCDELDEELLESLTDLLDYGYRRRFKLLEPTVSIDLSDVVLVLFASSVNENVKALASSCDLVRTGRITKEEKEVMIQNVFHTRANAFGIARATLDAEGVAYLTPFETGKICLLIDSALRQAAFNQESVITAKSLKTISTRQNINHSRREFGYVGGYYEAY